MGFHTQENNRRLSRRTFVLASALLLSGCGWHLRGVQSIPLASVYLKFGENSALGATFRRNLLARTDLNIVPTPEEAEAIFELPVMSRSQTVLAYNSEGQARIYDLKLTAAYRLTLQNGAEIIPLTTVSATRELNWDERDWNGKAQQEQLLYREMENSLIQQIVSSLAHITEEQVERAKHESV